MFCQQIGKIHRGNVGFAVLGQVVETQGACGHDHIRTKVEPVENDIVMHYPMVLCEEMVKNHEITAAAEAVCGTLR